MGVKATGLGPARLAAPAAGRSAPWGSPTEPRLGQMALHINGPTCESQGQVEGLRGQISFQRRDFDFNAAGPVGFADYLLQRRPANSLLAVPRMADEVPCSQRSPAMRSPGHSPPADQPSHDGLPCQCDQPSDARAACELIRLLQAEMDLPAAVEQAQVARYLAEPGIGGPCNQYLMRSRRGRGPAPLTMAGHVPGPGLEASVWAAERQVTGRTRAGRGSCPSLPGLHSPSGSDPWTRVDRGGTRPSS